MRSWLRAAPLLFVSIAAINCQNRPASIDNGLATARASSSTRALASSPIATATEATSASSAASAYRRSLPLGKSTPPAIALGTQGAVTSQESHATAIGLAVLRTGGNAVDAAIAVSFALAVTHPSAGNLGGGGFMVIHFSDGRRAAIDYREVAPLKAHRDMYLNAKGKPNDSSLVGALAAGIPGTVAGLALAHRRFGRLPWKRLVAPAIRLAESGHRLDTFHVADLRYGSRRMAQDGRTKSSSKYYLQTSGENYQLGDLWKQPELAQTLRAIAKQGAAGFYHGSVADKLIAGVRKAGGIWQHKDLANYQAKERRTVAFDYRGHTVLSMPPPSSGGAALRQILRARELLGEQVSWRSLRERHHFVESERRAFADRNLLMADSDRVAVPLAQLLSLPYIDARMQNISASRASKSDAIGAGLPEPARRPSRPPSEETTHFSVVDARGNAVATTTTLNTGFGSKFVVPATGVLLNNEMDDFAAAPGRPNAYGLVQGEANAIAPAKRMLSSMTPAIVLDANGRTRAVVGSPGGPTIISTVAQIIVAVVEHNITIDRAVAAPRIHHQWLPDKVFVEPNVPANLVQGLKSLGHRVQPRGPMGHANCIEVDRKTGGFRAVADVERDGGSALAY